MFQYHSRKSAESSVYLTSLVKIIDTLYFSQPCPHNTERQAREQLVHFKILGMTWLRTRDLHAEEY